MRIVQCCINVVTRYVQHESDGQFCSFLSNGCRTFQAVALCQLLQGAKEPRLETSCTHLDKKLQYCSSDSCCINKRSYEPLRNHDLYVCPYLKRYVTLYQTYIRTSTESILLQYTNVHILQSSWLYSSAGCSQHVMGLMYIHYMAGVL